MNNENTNQNPVFGPAKEDQKAVSLRDFAAALLYPGLVAEVTPNTNNREAVLQGLGARAYHLADMLLKAR
jgi:hypothetical protein